MGLRPAERVCGAQRLLRRTLPALLHAPAHLGSLCFRAAAWLSATGVGGFISLPGADLLSQLGF